MNQHDQPYLRPFLLLTLVAALYLSYTILAPFLTPIILAVVLAALFHPMHKRLTAKLGGRHTVSAILMVFVISFVIVIPILVITTAMIEQGAKLMVTIQEWIQAGNLEDVENLEAMTALKGWISSTFPTFDPEKLDIQNYLLDITTLFSNSFISSGLNILGNLAGVLTNFFIMMFLIFYLIRDGARMIEAIKRLSPLRSEQEDRIIDKIRIVSRSVFMGSLLTAVCQGIAGGIGLAIVGIPGLFWGAMLGVASLIPVVGTALIWVPVVGYLLLIGHWQSAIFFALWSALLVGSIDNFLRPFLMKGKGGLSPFYVFLGIIGGVQVYGLAGILFGPLIIGFAAVILFIYEEEFQGNTEESGTGVSDAEALSPADPETAESSPEAASDAAT
ncbi:MAG: AI-2E family transporter [Desulfovibrio sp.]|nr:MAG: AI-2E family transporter [Desulfovibrio sp.]